LDFASYLWPSPANYPKFADKTNVFVLFVTLKLFVVLLAVGSSIDHASVPHQGLVVGAITSALTSAGQIENNTTPRK